MRDDYAAFQERGAVILAIAPTTAAAVHDYWQREALPFTGLADPEHQVAKRYGQQVRLLRLGRMPTLVVVDRAGRIRYRHDGASMRDIPPNTDLLALLDRLNNEPTST